MSDKDLESFMQQSKMKHANLDMELDDLINDDPELKKLSQEDSKKNKKKKNFDEMDDINLSDLEEDEDEQDHKEDSLDLKDLEEEGHKDKLSENKEKSKDNKNMTDKVEKIDNNDITMNNEKKPEKSEKLENLEKSIPLNQTPKVIDIYSEKSENLYHRVDKMFSMGVLQDELSKMDEISKYKTKNGFEPDFFENKKFMIEAKMKEIENMITFGAMNLDEYKKSIGNQLKWEDELIIFAQKDQKISKEEVEVILTRINRRKELIKAELNQEVNEEEQEEIPVLEETNNQQVEKQNEDENMKNLAKEEENKPFSQNISIISEKSAAPVETKPKEIQNKKLYEEIKSRLNDYKDAALYFRKIGSAKQEEDAISKAKELINAVKLFESFDEKSVDEFSLPIGVTPDYICGESKQERLNHFSEIIKEFSKRKNELNDALQQRADKLKTIDKKEFAKIKDAVKKDFDDRKAKIEFYNKLIGKLTEYAKNPWVPSPLFSWVEEEERSEKINEEIDQYMVDIYIGKTTYDKNSAYLYVVLNLGENKQLEESVYFKEYPNYDHRIKWRLDKSEFNHLHRKTIEFQVWKKHWYWPLKSFLKGTLKIKLDKLKDCSKISDTFTYKLESERFSPSLDVTITIRQPITGKEYNVTSKAVMTITKTFPPFRGEGAVEAHNYPNNNKKIELDDNEIQIVTSIKTTQKTEIKPKEPGKQNNQPKPQVQKQKVVAPEDRIDAAEFSKDELTDPDNIDNLNSVKVLQFKIDKVQNEINNIEGRAPPKLREKLLKAKCKKNVLEQQLGDSITIENYISIMSNQLKKDQKLVKYFEQEGMMEQGKKVAERIPVLIKEIEEAIDFAKAKKR